MNIRTMLKFGFKYRVEDMGNYKEMRWFSQNFGEDGREYWFVFVLGERVILKGKGISFCWLHWNFGGSDHFVHIPNISQIQTEDGLLSLLYGLGYPKIEFRAEEDIEQRYEKNKEVFREFEVE